MFSARTKLIGKHFNIFCLFQFILIVFSIPVIIWNAEYRSPIRRFVNNWFLSRRAYNFPGWSRLFSMNTCLLWTTSKQCSLSSSVCKKNKTVTLHSPLKQEVEFALCFPIQTNNAFFRPNRKMNSISFVFFITATQLQSYSHWNMRLFKKTLCEPSRPWCTLMARGNYSRVADPGILVRFKLLLFNCEHISSVDGPKESSPWCKFNWNAVYVWKFVALSVLTERIWIEELRKKKNKTSDEMIRKKNPVFRLKE